MLVRISHIRKEHDRLMKEAITGFADIMLRDAMMTADDIVDISKERYHSIQRWKASMLSLPLEKRQQVIQLQKPVSRPSNFGKTPIEKANLKLHLYRHYSPGLAEAQMAVCLKCSAAKKDGEGKLTGCSDCGCAATTIIHRMGVVEKPAMNSSQAAVPSIGSSRSLTQCPRNGWPTLSFKSIACGCSNPNTRPLVFHLGATGLGDAIGGLYAACGLANSTGRKVIYYAHSEPWLRRIKHPNVEIRPRLANRRAMGVDGCYDDDYAPQIAHGLSRVQCYCDKLSMRLGVPKFSGCRPQMIDISDPDVPGQNEKPRIVMAPFCCYSSRDWDKYQQLTHALESMGYQVVGIGSSNQADRLKQLFGPTHAVFHWGADPESTIKLMLGAKLVIGNDSGIPHLGGLFGVPTISIHAGCLPHGFLFDYAPMVRSVTAGRGLQRSDHNPAALRSISTEMVMGIVRGVLNGK